MTIGNKAEPTTRPRLLIEDWLPIAEIGIESLRERTPMTPFPAPNRIHVWWARRPLVASRAAILASLLPADADRILFKHALGILGDPVGSKVRIAQATLDGVRLGKAAYGYNRAFTHQLEADEQEWMQSAIGKLGLQRIKVLDPTAGGGSIPFEAVRLGFDAVANELNPVAWTILSGTIDFPLKYGAKVLDRFTELAKDFRKHVVGNLISFYPEEPENNCIPDGYLWARTVSCPYCGGVVPLSPNWQLNTKGMGVRLVPHMRDAAHRYCTFEIVSSVENQSPGTVKGGDASCPFTDCGRVIDGEGEIKRQAQAGLMGQQLYTIIYKRERVIGHTKAGKPKIKKDRGYRAPRIEDNVESEVQAALAAKLPEWQARGIVPDEEIPPGQKTDEPRRSGMFKWTDTFSPRQLYGHCICVEVFREMVEELRRKNAGEINDLDRAAMVYIAIAMDKLLNYNSRMSIWMPTREVVANTFNRHDFAFCWSHSEMAPTIAGLGYDWALEQTGKALEELIELIGDQSCISDDGKRGQTKLDLGLQAQSGRLELTMGSADALSLRDQSIDCIVMDPPYYDNVMYAELADFFYVWLKRTVGLLYPEAFVEHLSDKDREAVANPAKFKGQKGGAKRLAGRDYQRRMAAIFTECRRVLKPAGVMTIMFTHKASGAWDALASGLVQAGFVITASWPINTEAEGSLHIKEKSAAKSTIFLVCRGREVAHDEAEPVYWEDVEPKVAAEVRKRVAEFQESGISGVDLYLASFGPALQVFSEHWPLTRGRAQQKPLGRQLELFEEEWDPYAVTPEDALLAARREVKRWRMDKLVTMKHQHELKIDPLTEWYVLAWDAFRAPRFPSDEALKLARVVGLDFDAAVKNVVCEVKSSDVILWDSKTRKAKNKLGPVSEDVMIDTLHHAAWLGREMNVGEAKAMLERARLMDDATLKNTLEALLRVLPAAGAGKDANLTGASADFVALEKLRRLCFAEEVPSPVVGQIEMEELGSEAP